jgi:hypothetical protein
VTDLVEDRERHEERLGVRVWEAVRLEEGVPLGVPLGVWLGVPLGVCDELTDRLEERLQNEVKLAVVLTLEVLEGVTDGYEVKDAVEVTDLVVLAEEPSDLEGVTLTLAVLDCDGEMLHGVLVGSAISSRRGVMRRSCG